MYKKEKQSNNNNSSNNTTFPPCPYYKKSNHPQKSSSTESWLIDSGCTSHMTYDQELFKELDKTAISKVGIENGAYLAIKGKGTVAIEGHIGREVFKVQMEGKSFALNLMEEEQAAVHKKDSNTMLWHRRLGHFHHTALLFIKKNNLGEGLPELEEELPTCVACQYGKQTRLPFPQNKAWRATQKLQLVKRDKLDKKAEPGIFVGYSSVSKAYRIYLPQNNKVIVSRDVQFFESDSWSWENDKKIEFQEENDKKIEFQEENDKKIEFQDEMMTLMTNLSGEPDHFLTSFRGAMLL
ncbi:hypothetical protein LWI29_025212 [Acer saccharum]|uniref:GAG-pre-integrase domain-containing protein n=1 Tax=Acer saccharum TaxID=4024 RepID=A0AA39VAT0_ACESA|nr:hypothetical protein LWI29_025212 [Acer saccharum]